MSKKYFKNNTILLILLFAFLFNFYHLTYKISNPLRETEHGFRQCQTAISTYWLIQDGFKLAYETPILGPNWSIPIEFASFQYVVAFVVKIINSPLDITGRIISILFFYGCLFWVFKILKELKFHSDFLYLSLSIILINPIYCFWPRAFLYETTALFLSLGFVFYAIKYFDTQKYKYLIFSFIFGIFAAPTKITTFLVYVSFVGFLFIYIYLKNANTKSFILTTLIIICPIIISFLWNYYADSFKINHLIAYKLTSKVHLTDWILSDLNFRFSKETWIKILYDSKFIIYVFPLFIVLFFLKFWKNALICLCFWILPLLFFTKLYYVHGYYNVANGVFLSLFVSFILYSIFKIEKIWALPIMLFIFGFITIDYKLKFNENYLPSLNGKYDDIFFTSKSLQKYVKPNQTFIIFNSDWHSELPYYSQRKAIMIPSWIDDSPINLLKICQKLPPSVVMGVAILGDLPSQNSKIYNTIKILGFNPDNPIALSEEGYWWHWYSK